VQYQPLLLLLLLLLLVLLLLLLLLAAYWLVGEVQLLQLLGKGRGLQQDGRGVRVRAWEGAC